MKISTNSRYAIRFLARLADGNLHSVSAVAEAEGISEKMLERIVSKLRKDGLLVSAKGATGGYKLAKAAEDISVYHVIRLMETAYLPIHCSADYNEKCTMCDGCAIAALWEDVENAVKATTEKVSIADIKR